ncbi:MAG: type II secretion system F family protein [Candidatus Nanohaloarchaea archaeon]
MTDEEEDGGGRFQLDFFKEEEYQAGRPLEDKVVFGSIGVAAVLILVGILLYLGVSQQIGGLTVILGLLVGIMPYGLLSFLKNRAIREMEDQFPVFLKDLAESKRGGMTILRAFESSMDTDYGRLNPEIEKVYRELTWGIPFPEVMRRFSRRMEDSAVIQESLSIIIQSFESGGNITQTIEAVAEDAGQLREVIQEKNAKLKQQLVIMYVIYFLFIGITIGIYIMLAQLLGLGSSDPGALASIGQVIGQGGGGQTQFCGGDIAASRPFCTTARIFGFVPANVTFGSQYSKTYGYGNMAYYKSLLFSMLMIQGMATAAVAGQVAEGSPSAGIKHALVMLPLAFIAFMFVVAPAGL